MADAKLTDLTADASPTSDDITYVVDAPGGAATSKKVTLANLGKAIDHSVLTNLTVGDPHTQYRLEAADHTHQSSGAQAGQLDHGLALTGLTDDDHSAYLLASDATDRATFATNWLDLTDGGQTTLHSHAGTSVDYSTVTGKPTDLDLYDAATTAEKFADRIFAGSNITITEVADGDAVVIAASGTGSPAGSDTQIQYNNAGSFGATADFRTDSSGGYRTLRLNDTDGAQITFSTGGTEWWGLGSDGEVGGTNRDFFLYNTPLGSPAMIVVGDSSQVRIGNLISGSSPFTETPSSFLSSNSITSHATNTVSPVNGFYARYTATDGSATLDGSSTFQSRMEFGFGGVAAIGTGLGMHTDVFIEGCGSASNEYAALVTTVSAQIGTGFTQTAGPVGRLWHLDGTVLGPINVQPNTMNGSVIIMNNYYNGGPADSPSGGFWLTTKGDGGNDIDATHSAATTYPLDVGIGIVGQSSNSGVGWTTGIQIGGTGSPWGEAASKLNKGITIQDCVYWGIESANPVRVQNFDIGFEDAFQNTQPWETAFEQNTAIGVINIVLDGGGSAITTGIKIDVSVPFNCTIIGNRVLADQSGSIVIDIWKDSYANYPPTVLDTITASAKPTLSTATKSEDITLTGWTTAINAGDTIRINVDSATTVTRVTLALMISRL